MRRPTQIEHSSGITLLPVPPVISVIESVPVPSSVHTTGLPQAIASSCTVPNASLRRIDGSTKISLAA